MDAGQIVEQGTFDELMDMKGRFYDLAMRQIS
jgi:ABC-type multidrug transport system fused ATPase/permease subunit